MTTECGLTNLAICLPEKFFEYLSIMFNAPVQPLLNLINKLLTAPANVSLFHSLWAIIIYILSLFYGLFFLFAGFNFLISGYDSAKREKAKDWIRNVVLMVLFVQGSFLIYSLIIELGSLLTSGVMQIIDPNFFRITLDNFSDISLQLVLLFPYLSALLLTVILLALRYLFVVIGVVFFPFAMFFYFIPPLKSYGKLILNVLLAGIFVPFFSALLLLGASVLMNLELFSGFQIVLLTTAFLSIDLLMMMLLAFAILKAVFGVLNSEVGSDVKMAVKYLS